MNKNNKLIKLLQKTLRESDLTVEQFASTLGISRQHYYNITSGKTKFIDFDIIKLLQKSYDIEWQEIAKL